MQHNGPKDHPLEKGTDGWKIHAAITPLEGDSIVEKRRQIHSIRQT